MLIDYEFPTHPVTATLAIMNGYSPDNIRLEQGVYQRGHFGHSPFHPLFESWPELGEVGCYGVCDDYKQILDKIPALQADPDRKFVVFVTPVLRADQPRSGGWRWHKWGEYIGVKTPTTEYLHDEEDIDRVYCYHIYEKVK